MVLEIFLIIFIVLFLPIILVCAFKALIEWKNIQKIEKNKSNSKNNDII